MLPTATPSEIKRAYRKLAAQHHPDRGGDTVTFQTIQAAYQHLRTSNTVNNNAVSKRGRDLHISIVIPLPSTLTEQTREVTVRSTDSPVKLLSITIPRGVPHQGVIKYPGLGEPGANSQHGDLFVTVAISLSDNAWIHDDELFQRITLNALTALTGGSHEFCTPFGDQVEIIIPRGTQPGTRFRLSEHGLMGINGQRTALIVVSDIFVPLLTDEQCKIATLLN